MSEKGSGDGRARAGAGGGVLRWCLRAGLVLAGMVLSAAAGSYIVLLITVRGREAIVPDLTRMSQTEAEAEAARQHLRVEVAGTRPEPRVGEGRIFEQEPRPGASTRPGRTIKVFLSGGQQWIEVPSFAGQPLRKVQLTLTQMGLRVGSVATVNSPDQSPEGVLAQSPGAGARRQKGDAVDLLVSRGVRDRTYVMPLLEGLQVERANSILKDAGVRVGLSRRPAQGAARSGIVLEQRPLEGFPLRERQAVQLVVAE